MFYSICLSKLRTLDLDAVCIMLLEIKPTQASSLNLECVFNCYVCILIPLQMVISVAVC